MWTPWRPPPPDRGVDPQDVWHDAPLSGWTVCEAVAMWRAGVLEPGVMPPNDPSPEGHPMDAFLHSPPFAARFPGECAEGGDEIDPGDRIVMVDGAASHVECVDHDDCPDNATCG